MNERIKEILDRECRNRFQVIRNDAEQQEVLTGGMVRCDDGRSFPTGGTCWMCHKHDALAAEIAELEEIG